MKGLRLYHFTLPRILTVSPPSSHGVRRLVVVVSNIMTAPQA
jgi:hypothetical protein